MKGWHFESYRHSLAARGIQTRRFNFQGSDPFEFAKEQLRVQEKAWRKQQKALERAQKETEAETELQEASKELAEVEQMGALQEEIQQSREAALRTSELESERQAEFLGALVQRTAPEEEYIGPVIAEEEKKMPKKIWFRPEGGELVPVEKMSVAAEKKLKNILNEEDFDKEVELSPEAAVKLMKQEGESDEMIRDFLKPFESKKSEEIIDVVPKTKPVVKLPEDEWVVMREQKKFTVPLGSYKYGVGVSTKRILGREVLPSSIRFIKIPRGIE